MKTLDYRYKAAVIKVIDADTIDFEVDVGFQVGINIRTRLFGINAPEMRTIEGRAAKTFVDSLLSPGDAVYVNTFKDPKDKYGRWLANVELCDGAILNNLLIAAGHAKPFLEK